MEFGTAYLSNMFWVPKHKIKLNDFKNYFRLTRLSYNTDTYDYIYAYDETEYHLGVPRYWASQHLKSSGTTEIVDDTVAPEIEWPSITLREEGYRKGQLAAILTIRDRFLVDKAYGSLLQAKCGSGKTVCSLDIASRMNIKTLVTVHKQDLEDQWLATAKNFFPTVEVGIVRQNLWDYENKHLVIASTQTLYARRNEYPDNFLKSFGLIIYDEGHLYPAETFQYVLKAFPARYRLGISATWDRKDSLDQIWEWHVGKIDHRMDSETLGGVYFVHPWKIIPDFSKFASGYEFEMARFLTAVGKDIEYNRYIVKNCIIPAYNEGRKILIPSDRIEQLELLYTEIKKINSSVPIGVYANSIFGKNISKEHQRLGLTANVILGTFKKLNEGTDVPDADTLILVSPRADVRQIVGRIQRIHEGKKDLQIHDFVHDAGLTNAMFRKRAKIYHSLGFKESKYERY